MQKRWIAINGPREVRLAVSQRLPHCVIARARDRKPALSRDHLQPLRQCPCASALAPIIRDGPRPDRLNRAVPGE